MENRWVWIGMVSTVEVRVMQQFCWSLVHSCFSFYRADILVSRVIRHVLRVHDGYATLFPDSPDLQFPKKFRFADNNVIIGNL